MIKVKITNTYPDWQLIRQTPGEKGIWNNCQFFINDDTDSCDYWVVLDGLTKKESVHCPKENTILITGEPPIVKAYNRKFVRQFAKIITCHHDIKHENKIYSQQALPWMIGYRYRGNRIWEKIYTKNYDELNNEHSSIKKIKNISVISSDKKITSGHSARLAFVNFLKNHFKEKVDIFGRGINTFSDKWEVISPYKYHIVLENTSIPDYWSEKLADAFLCNSYPLYYGCTNIYDYFDTRSLSIFNIHEPRKAIDIIERAIFENYYEKYQQQIIESKNLILNKYQLFPMISDLINNSITPANNKKKILLTIKPEKKNEKNIIAKIFSKFSKTFK